ncbi:MAG TPA: carboxypeptidase regulatory-like domain-containing protein [Pyrinomonadaceae bacterium]|nr:carboxypeptidase regulatory-like domain-containing protein [Pyrinomonadaceae bacterium]
MVPSARKVIGCILLIFGVAVYSHSQTGPTKQPTASIGGKVTTKGKGVQGVSVVANAAEFDYSLQGGSYRATTDQDGKYRIANMPAGTYRLYFFAPTFVPDDQDVAPVVVIADGEKVDDINVGLVRGGIITGKITSSDGQPAIAEQVYITPVGPHDENPRYYPGRIVTDDRGIYRAFGLRPAKYKVWVGAHDHAIGARYRHTFYPSVTDETKATVIEVREGSETANVDIVAVRDNVPGYKVSGRIVDGETGQPLARVPYGLMRLSDDGGYSVHHNVVTNADGQFNFENITPGHYAVFIVRENTELRAKPTPFEVIDGDVSGLVMKTLRTASLSGLVVFEGKPLDRTPGDLMLHAWIDSDSEYAEDVDPKHIDANGRFRMAGLTSGTVYLSVYLNNRRTQVGIVRVERDGLVLPRGFPLQEGEQIENLRVVVKLFTGAIRGQLKFEDGDMPPPSQISVLVVAPETEVNYSPGGVQGAHVDARGRFAVDGLNAGSYEIQVTVFRDGRVDPAQTVKQRVTVADNAVSEVTLTIKPRQD